MKTGLAKLAVAFTLLAVLPGTGHVRAQALQAPAQLAEIYAHSVDKRLDLPADEAQRYGQLLQARLSEAGLEITRDQVVILVDRHPHVQALLMYWLPAQGVPVLLGASPVSTGRSGGFEHFLTPLGVFEHSPANPDFRAEGTRNEQGVRGYGRKGLRIFDFGWQPARKTWGDRAPSVMRLQVHATDPDLLEPRLGSAQSKGCIRIPASLNKLIDQYGLLDAAYEQAPAQGKAPSVLHPQRMPTPWSGRYLVVLQTERAERPSWSPDPRPAKKSPSARSGQGEPTCA